MTKKKKGKRVDNKGGKHAASTVNAERIERLEWPDKLMVWTVGSMARLGPKVLAELEEAIGMKPSSGHAVDAMMNAAAEMEKAALAGDAERFADAMLVTLFLARDVSVRQGKIRNEVPPEQLS